MDDDAGVFNFTRGNKFFELGNHLGNVLATVSDKKVQVDMDNNGLVDYYQADVVTANDYYPFGMTMPGRKFMQVGKSYRYSINGQEKDGELNENITTALYWEYDSRIARRWNLDPVPQVGISEYACFGNSPIYLSDVNGDDPGPSGKKSKGYDWANALRYQCIHYNGAMVAYQIYKVRQHFGHYGTKYNDAYKNRIDYYAAKSFKEQDMGVTGIDAAAYAKVIGGYYEIFEKGFNWAGDRTMRELKFIFDNKYGAAKDIFEPNLSVNQARDAIAGSTAMLDDLKGTAYTIGAWGDEVFMKCTAIAGLFAMRASSGIGNLNLSKPGMPYKGSELQQQIINTGAAKTGGKELYNFGKTAAQHMTEPGRKVPLQILDDVIKNTKGLPDPGGSGALMHYSPMWRNGKLYNLEVLYDKASNSIWHFKYSPIKP